MVNLPRLSTASRCALITKLASESAVSDTTSMISGVSGQRWLRVDRRRQKTRPRWYLGQAPEAPETTVRPFAHTPHWIRTDEGLVVLERVEDGRGGGRGRHGDWIRVWGVKKEGCTTDDDLSRSARSQDWNRRAHWWRSVLARGSDRRRISRDLAWACRGEGAPCWAISWLLASGVDEGIKCKRRSVDGWMIRSEDGGG